MTEEEIKARLAANRLAITTAQQIIAFIKEKLSESKSNSIEEN